MQQSVFIFLGLMESNNSSVNEITFRLCLPRTDYDTRAVLRDEMYILPRRLNKLPQGAIALQQSSLTTVTPELLSLRHSLTCNA